MSQDMSTVLALAVADLLGLAPASEQIYLGLVADESALSQIHLTASQLPAALESVAEARQCEISHGYQCQLCAASGQEMVINWPRTGTYAVVCDDDKGCEERSAQRELVLRRAAWGRAVPARVGAAMERWLGELRLSAAQEGDLAPVREQR